MHNDSHIDHEHADKQPSYDFSVNEVAAIFGDFYTNLPKEYIQFIAKQGGKHCLKSGGMIHVVYGCDERDSIIIRLFYHFDSKSCEDDLEYFSMQYNMESIKELGMPHGVFPIAFTDSGFQGELYIDLRMNGKVKYGFICWEKNGLMVPLASSLDELFTMHEQHDIVVAPNNPEYADFLE